MIISEKQIIKLLNQLHDHIDCHKRMSVLGIERQDYIDWLCELLHEITEQQSEELKVIE